MIAQNLKAENVLTYIIRQFGNRNKNTLSVKKLTNKVSTLLV